MPDLGEKRAIVDVGSNSLLLTVCNWNGSNWSSIYESSEVTGLGEGVKVTQRIESSKAEKTLRALAVAFKKANELGASVRAYGTMALRIAENAEEFIRMANEQQTPVTVLSGEDEAKFGLLSVLEDEVFGDSELITIIDVGGHSTEIASSRRLKQKWKTTFRKSFSVGTLSIRDTVLSMESPNGLELLRATKTIDDLFGLRYLPNQTGKVVALGASATNLISIREKHEKWMPEIVHGSYLDFEEISQFVHLLSGLTEIERSQLIGIEKGREKSIHIGALILERALQAVHGLGVYISVKGWRHAIMNQE